MHHTFSLTPATYEQPRKFGAALQVEEDPAGPKGARVWSLASRIAHRRQQQHSRHAPATTPRSQQLTRHTSQPFTQPLLPPPPPMQPHLDLRPQDKAANAPAPHPQPRPRTK